MSESRHTRPSVVPDLPAVLYIETTNRCDSLCQTCIRTFQTLAVEPIVVATVFKFLAYSVADDGAALVGVHGHVAEIEKGVEITSQEQRVR